MLLVLLFLLILIVLCVTVITRRAVRRFPPGTIGFLHPSAASGGGGERVLWVAIKALQEDDVRNSVNRRYVLYVSRRGGIDSQLQGSQWLMDIVNQQFGIQLVRPLEVVFLNPALTKYLDGNCYPFATLILQAVCGSILLFYELCIVNNITPIVIESVGIPGIYPLLTLISGTKLITYTHYPVITTTMTHRVENGETRFNNRGILARNNKLRRLKVVYYKLFARFYQWLGQFPVLAMTNSTWTSKHIEKLWAPKSPVLVYPPCAIKTFLPLRRSPEERQNTIVSVGQFRPEKNHLLQLKAFARARDFLPRDAKLIMVGGARNDSDKKRAAIIVQEAEKLHLSHCVEVRIGAPFNEVCQLLSTCCIGLHTMEDEHFGIVVVEYIACGCIPLAHNSGGVCLDILATPGVGFLATTEEEYADRMVEIFALKLKEPHVYAAYQERGARSITSFSDECFEHNFCSAISHFVKT